MTFLPESGLRSLDGTGAHPVCALGPVAGPSALATVQDVTRTKIAIALFISITREQTRPGYCSQTEEIPLATNKPVGDNARKGAVRKRSQLKTAIEGEEHRTKRSKEIGQFMDQETAS